MSQPSESNSALRIPLKNGSRKWKMPRFLNLNRRFFGQLVAEFQKKPVKHKAMVGWFDPGQLLQTAGEVIVSSIIGRHADRRLIEQLATQDVYFDFSDQHTATPMIAIKKDEELHPVKQLLPNSPRKDDVWIDYVSDVGDGWNATYGVAHQLAKPMLKVQDKQNNSYELKRGDILIFGGDEVYPKASRDEYRERWTEVYADAFAGGPTTDSERPYAFAIPGNHDWYDSLATFSELFSGSYIKNFPASADPSSSLHIKTQGGWKTPQSRSYFALKLPYQWWLFGVDLQLDHDLDEPQLNYFKKVMREFQAGDRVILCSPEPFWIYTQAFKDVEKKYSNSRLIRLVNDLEDKVKVYLAGDLHHYYRIKDSKDSSKSDGLLNITAGGGGAFMHPTHGQPNEEYSTENKYQIEAYPDMETSRQLTWRNLFFPLLNVRFNIVTGVLYLLTAWSLMAGIGKENRSKLISEAGESWESVSRTIWIFFKAGKTFWEGALFENPFLVILCPLVIGGFIAFTDSNARRLFRVLGGGIHGLTHLAGAGLITWLGCVVFAEISDDSVKGSLLWVAGWLSAILWVSVAGALFGSMLMGIYLLISLNFFGYHVGEGSSLKIEGYKNFLRMKLSPNGDLTIYAIGLDEVPRWSDSPLKSEWEEVTHVASSQPSRFVPREPNKFAPRVIDGPLKYPLE